MFCKYCGKKAKDNSIYCSRCGKNIVEDMPPPVEKVEPLPKATPTQTQVHESYQMPMQTQISEVSTIPAQQEQNLYDKNPHKQKSSKNFAEYQFTPLSSDANLAQIRQYWGQKLETVSITTKWLDFYVRILLTLNLVLMPLTSFSEYVDVISNYYDYDLSLFFSVPINGIIFLIDVSGFLAIIFAKIYLTRWNPRGITSLWILACLHTFGTFFTIICCYLTGDYSIAMSGMSHLIATVVLYIPNLIYFEKRRFMYYQHSLFNPIKPTISKNSKIGIAILFSINSLLFIWSLVIAFV